MSGNRTKTDWAYKQAQKIVLKVRTSSDGYATVREVAAILRRVSRCGRMKQAAYPARRDRSRDYDQTRSSAVS